MFLCGAASDATFCGFCVCVCACVRAMLLNILLCIIKRQFGADRKQTAGPPARPPARPLHPIRSDPIGVRFGSCEPLSCTRCEQIPETHRAVLALQIHCCVMREMLYCLPACLPSCLPACLPACLPHFIRDPDRIGGRRNIGTLAALVT